MGRTNERMTKHIDKVLCDCVLSVMFYIYLMSNLCTRVPTTDAFAWMYAKYDFVFLLIWLHNRIMQFPKYGQSIKSVWFHRPESGKWLVCVCARIDSCLESLARLYIYWQLLGVCKMLSYSQYFALVSCMAFTSWTIDAIVVASNYVSYYSIQHVI